MNSDLDSYDRFARVYDRLWAGTACARFWPIVQRLLLTEATPGATVLDLCCGTGRMCAELRSAGFRPIGVDGSGGMIELARERHPGLDFRVSKCFDLEQVGRADAVICLYDSLNHLDEDELERTFAAVFAALRPGWFLFDLNMDAGYEARWRGSFSIVKNDVVAIASSRYEADSKVGQMNLTTFLLDRDRWERADLVFRQRAFAVELVQGLLSRTGFVDLQILDAERDLALAGERGRLFFHCRRPD